MSLLSRLRLMLSHIRRFGRSESGMTLPLLAASLVMLTGMIGIAIDTARAQLVQSKLQFSLDAAGLAAGSTVSTADLTTEVNKYLDANFNGYLGATLTNVSAQANSTTTLITLNATATLPTTFLQALGVSTMTLTANSQVTRQIAGLEVTLVIDVSYGDDLTDFKKGLNDFVQTLFTSAAGTSQNLYVSIVPFNQTVNIGTNNASWLTAVQNPAIPSVGWGPNNSWGGCVMARDATEEVTDDPPASGSPNTQFNMYYYPSDTISTIQSKLNVSNTTATGDFDNYVAGHGYPGWAALNAKQQTDSLTSSAFANDYGLNIWQGQVLQPGNQQYYISPLNATQQGPNFMCPPPIAPLTNNETTVLNTINSISVIQGDWVPDLGLDWGWNTLSPRWQGMWGNITNGANQPLPLPYNTHGWNKAVVWVEGIAEASIGPGPDNHIYGAYGYLNQGLLGTTNMTTAQNTIMSRADAICSAMKNNNIYVYVLGYSANNSVSGLIPGMSNCSTAANYTFWFGPGDWGAFDTELNAIADSLVNLAVSK